jgi:hypothetical protein
MSKPVFLELQAFYQVEGKMDESCSQCLDEAQDKAEALGLNVEKLQEQCEDLCSEDIDESIDNLQQETMLIKIEDIRSISQTKKGRALIQSEGSILPRLYATTYDEVMEKISPHITIV